MTGNLKLIALDADDLAVISAHVQDARLQFADIVWRQSEKRLVLGLSRPDWEETLLGTEVPGRLVAALRFDRVLACKSRELDLGASRRGDRADRDRIPSRRRPRAASRC